MKRGLSILILGEREENWERSKVLGREGKRAVYYFVSDIIAEVSKGRCVNPSAPPIVAPLISRANLDCFYPNCESFLTVSDFCFDSLFVKS